MKQKYLDMTVLEFFQEFFRKQQKDSLSVDDMQAYEELRGLLKPEEFRSYEEKFFVKPFETNWYCRSTTDPCDGCKQHSIKCHQGTCTKGANLLRDRLLHSIARSQI